MTVDLIAISDALANELVPMPGDATDVCPMCRSGRTSPTALCNSCVRTSGQVTHSCPVIIPISFYAEPSPLRDRMHDFKEHADATIRARESQNVAAIAARYVTEHRDALAETFGAWDATVAVPSTHHHGEPALQAAIVSNFPDVFAPFAQPLIRGPGRMKFNQASETGFLTAEDVAGKSFLLIDDTLTTGARLHSAHHALVAADATVPAAIVVTRKINPSALYGTLELWNRQTQIEFRFDSPPWWRAPQDGTEAGG